MSHDLDLTAPTVLRGVHKDVREIVKGAALLEWTGRKAGRGGLILYSPDGIHKVSIPITVNHNGVPKRIARDIVRYTPDSIKTSVTDRVMDSDDQGGIVSLGTLVRDAQGVFGPELVAQLEPEVEPTTQPVEQEPAVFIVKAQPWKARVSSDGVTADLYDSPAVIERTWSDGSTDYMCSYCEEKYVAAKPRSISSHYARHTVAGETPRSTQEPNVFDAKIDGFRTVRVAHLAKEIEAALTSRPLDQAWGESNQVFARQLAEAIIIERITKGKEKASDEPVLMGPDEILARIKTLVLRDEHKHAEIAEKQAENLRAQIVELEAEKQAAIEGRAQAEGKWQALRELVSDG